MPMRRLYALFAGSLTRRLVFAIAVLHAVLIAGFVVDQLRRENEVLLEQARSSLLSEVELLSRSGREWVLSSDVAGLEELLAPVRGAPGLEYAMYLDTSGQVLVHSEPRRAGQRLVDPLSLSALADDTVAGPRLIQRTRALSDALAPIRQGERLIGWVRVARNHDAEALAISAAVRDGVLYALTALLVSTALATVLARGLTSDLRRAQQLFERVREGDLTPRLAHRRADELGDLLDGINDTLDALARNEGILQRTQERLELAVKGSNDGIWDWDLISNEVYYSPRWKQMLGYEDDELVSRPDAFLDRVHPDDLPVILDRINDYLEGRIPVFELIIRARHRDGDWRWILTRGSAVRGRDGRARRMSGAHTDVTALKQAEAGLALERSRLYGLLAQMYTGVIMEDAEGRIAVCNRAFCELFPLVENPSELVGRRRDEVFAEVRDLFAGGDEAMRRIDDIMLRGEPVIGERVDLTDGRLIERDCLPIRVGEVRQGVLWTFRDISSRMRLEHSLAAEKERLRVTLLAIADAVISTDASGHIDFLNPAAEQLTGWHNDQAARRPLGEVLRLIDPVLRRERPDPVAHALEEGLGRVTDESLVLARGGDEKVVEHSAAPIRDALGGVSGAVVVLHDTTDRYRMQERLRWQATHDPLTGLANRVLLEDRLTQAMARARRQDRLLAVCVLDLDDFKAVNDHLGHEAGDALLQEIARRLGHSVRADDTVARLGGDEFVVLLGALSDVAEMETCLQRMLDALAEPVRVAGSSVVTPASIGVTLYPLNDSDADALLRHADQAMYEAKQAGGRCYRLFDFLNSQVSVERLRRRERIGEAITRGEMRLYYQPRVDMREGRMMGVEALVRWQHPDEGLLAPDSFLPLIEHDPEIHRLGEWVVRTALAQLAAWRAEGGRFGVSVNISAPHLLSPGFVTRLSELLAEQPQLPRQALEIEVVESVALDDIERAAAVVSDIRRLGVRVAIDDFGVGYASLGYLRRLPVDVVKIDKSFVLDMLDDEDDFEVVQAVIALAHALRREVVAEGVETAEHGLMLQRLGCSQIQGYGIARPLPADALMRWLADWRPDPRWAEWRDAGNGSDDLQLFSAVRDFNRWTEQVLGLAEGRPARLADEEIRDPTRCRFGQWFHDGGQQRYGDFEEYRAVDRSHRALHELAVRIADSSARGDRAAAQAAAVKLRVARDDLGVRIEALQRAARRRALSDR
ncbi:EAL domain-containing protein [Methyloversatilis universalis]|uniref:EAL domain-containing protein n=1 Tax=Methyloversatilis universalis TaxID=378211 RepID=UPI00036A262A|nr:EAL domain-containing protein [Methyloversatilis universalis]